MRINASKFFSFLCGIIIGHQLSAMEALTLNTLQQEFYQACSRGDEKTARLLLDTYKLDVNFAMFDYTSICADFFRHSDAMQFITPLSAAVKSGNVALVSLIAKASTELNKKEYKGQTILFKAKMGAMVQALVTAGASTGILDDDGMTPLTYGIKDSNADIAHVLLKNNADPYLSPKTLAFSI